MASGGVMKKGYAAGGMTKKKAYAAGGMAMVTNKEGDRVPAFAADGVGKMAKGGMTKAKMMASGGAVKKKMMATKMATKKGK